MNFGLIDNYQSFSFEELSADAIENVSGGSGFGFGLAAQAVGGLGTLAAGISGFAGAVSLYNAGLMGAAAALTVGAGGVILAAGAGVAIGYAAYQYFG